MRPTVFNPWRAILLLASVLATVGTAFYLKDRYGVEPRLFLMSVFAIGIAVHFLIYIARTSQANVRAPLPPRQVDDIEERVALAHLQSLLNVSSRADPDLTGSTLEAQRLIADRNAQLAAASRTADHQPPSTSPAVTPIRMLAVGAVVIGLGVALTAKELGRSPLLAIPVTLGLFAFLMAYMKCLSKIPVPRKGLPDLLFDQEPRTYVSSIVVDIILGLLLVFTGLSNLLVP